MILCASGLRFASGGVGDVDGLVRLAADAGFDGIAIGPECERRQVIPLCTAALAAGLAVPVGAALLPDEPLGPGRRLPYLASLDDGDERRAAVASFSSLVDLVVPLGIRTLAVNLGDVALGAEQAAITYRFARRELGEDDPGEKLWAAAVGERRALSAAVLDACRHALDRILPLAERRGVQVALEVAGGPWSAPSPREAMTLFQEYKGGPIGLIWDDGRMQALDALGIGPSEEKRAGMAAAALLSRANEAVGIYTGFLPGLVNAGARAGAAAADSVAADQHVEIPWPVEKPVVVAGRLDSTAREVTVARARVAAAITAKARRAESQAKTSAPSSARL